MKSNIHVTLINKNLNTCLITDISNKTLFKNNNNSKIDIYDFYYLFTPFEYLYLLILFLTSYNQSLS